MDTKPKDKIITIVKNEWDKRKERNASYSLRALARDLGTSPTSLSLFFKGNRPLTLDNALDWASKLSLDTDTRKSFLEAITLENHLRLDPTEKQAKKLEDKLQYVQLKLDQFAIISDWHHLGILNLSLLSRFKSNKKWISKELGISLKQCNEAIDRLVRLGLMEEVDGNFVRTVQNLETPSDIPSLAIRNFHRQNINRALDSIDETDIEERDITSIMMPLDKEKLEEAKKRIRNFRKELSSFLKDGSKGERVYSLNIQLFPQDRGL